MKMAEFLFLLAFCFSAIGNAEVLNCGANGKGDPTSQYFVGEIWPSESCPSGYGLKVGHVPTCAEFSGPIQPRVGPIEACGYFNGEGIVISYLQPRAEE